MNQLCCSQYRVCPEFVFLHRIRCAKLFEAFVKLTKIHVQIMRFKCCLNMVFNLTMPKLSPKMFAWHYKGKQCGLDWSFCWCFCSRKRCTRLWRCGERCNDVRKVDADAILFREIKCNKRDVLMFKRRFPWGLGWNQVNMQE